MKIQELLRGNKSMNVLFMLPANKLPVAISFEDWKKK